MHLGRRGHTGPRGCHGASKRGPALAGGRLFAALPTRGRAHHPVRVLARSGVHVQRLPAIRAAVPRRVRRGRAPSGFARGLLLGRGREHGAWRRHGGRGRPGLVLAAGLRLPTTGALVRARVSRRAGRTDTVATPDAGGPAGRGMDVTPADGTPRAMRTASAAPPFHARRSAPGVPPGVACLARGRGSADRVPAAVNRLALCLRRVGRASLSDGAQLAVARVRASAGVYRSRALLLDAGGVARLCRLSRRAQTLRRPARAAGQRLHRSGLRRRRPLGRASVLRGSVRLPTADGDGAAAGARARALARAGTGASAPSPGRLLRSPGGVEHGTHRTIPAGVDCGRQRCGACDLGRECPSPARTQAHPLGDTSVTGGHTARPRFMAFRQAVAYLR